MNVHPEPTESEVKAGARALWIAESDDQAWAEQVFEDFYSPADDLSAEAFDLSERVRAVLVAARRAVAPEPERGDAVERALQALGHARSGVTSAAMRRALEAAAVVPVQTPPEPEYGEYELEELDESGYEDDAPASPVPSREAIAEAIERSFTKKWPNVWSTIYRTEALSAADAVLALWGTPTEPTTEQEP